MARRTHRDNLRRFFLTRSAFALRTSAVPKHHLHQFLSYEALTPRPLLTQYTTITARFARAITALPLPLTIPAKPRKNDGTDTKTHERCDDVVPRGPTNPGAMLRLSMLAAPTSNGPVWELTSAKAP